MPANASSAAAKERLASRIEGSTGIQAVGEKQAFGQRKAPLIIYASRTHSQLAQVVRELATTVYRPKISVVGSREQLCIHPSVKNVGSNTAQQALCQQLVKKRSCSYHQKVPESVPAFQSACQAGKLFDIEELVKFGQSHQACPYFVSREGNADADVLFMPYNYLVDRKSRGGLGLDLSNAVIIFDEAHNLEGICGDAASFDVCTDELRAGQREVAEVDKIIRSPTFYGTFSENDTKHVQTFLASLVQQIMAVPLADNHYTSRGDFMFELMARCGITVDNMRPLLERIGNISKLYLEDLHAKGKAGIKCSLQALDTILRTLYRASADDDKLMMHAFSAADCAAFRIYITQDTASKDKKRTMSLWCFNPGVALRDLRAANVRSIILASGTLSPMASFAQELQIEFKQQLENAHVITAAQLFVSVLRTGPGGAALNSSFAQRDSAVYKTELGLAIAKAALQIPDGLLVFFPSYSVMEGCTAHWKATSAGPGSTTLWSAILGAKPIFIEPKSKTDLVRVMEQYSRTISESHGKGAIFLAVCRGKVSEGLDFADAKGRAVIVTGIPFPPVKDPKVVLKKDYLQDAAKASRTASLTGDEWYNQQASRAVNQAIGRVIRHRNDYGAILFFDDRFCQQRIISQLSKWIRPHVRAAESFPGLMAELARFFHDQGRGKQEAHFLQEQSNALAMSEMLQKSADHSAALRQESFMRARQFFRQNPFETEKDAQAAEVSEDIPLRLLDVFKPEVPKPVLAPAPADADVQQAKLYLAEVKERLPEEASQRFNTLLKSYKARKIECGALLDALLSLYAGHAALDLIDGFRPFVSQRNQALFLEKVAAFRSRVPSKRPPGQAPILHAPQAAPNPRPHIRVEPAAQRLPLSQPHATAAASQGEPCLVCREAANKPFRAKCGHVCCFGCWASWLASTLECPLCRQRTRLSQLTKIYQ